ncbi:signal transduction histidine kinase [Caldicoprobacter guelmensis]|uniref:sensor histidine kinase n=1 Tax=Caldicoprobacter guelmensis TaxID=1170224 RepID=UPI00195BCBEF|nr:ATP-binding protein [Caldicoprobacter guelmensis]MBM7581664.1 signal transduction histidine kinase [Caldicoprobacter guelmensis]
MFRSIFTRLMVTYFVIIVVTIIILSLLLSTFFMDYAFNTKARDLIREAQELNPYIEMYSMGLIDRRSLYSYFKVIDRFLNTTIWVSDGLGYIWIVYSPSKEDQERWQEQKLTEEEFIQILKGNIITKTGRFGGRFDVPVLTVGVPLRINNRIRGAIFLHSPVEGIKRTLYDIYKNIWWAAFISAGLSVILLYWMSRRISNPLIQMNEISREFAQGNFKRRVKVVTKDEIGQLAVNFNAMADSLEKLEDMRRSFVANVSHELRSPLTSIMGYIQGVLDNTIKPEDREKYLSISLSEAQRLSKLIDELLDLTQIESGQFPLNISVFDINEQIRRSLISQEERINQKGIEVQVEFQDEHCWVEADADRIQQVVINLLDNAIKYNRENGKLIIKTWKHRDKVYVKIQDQGPGIPKEDIVHIWERFYQVDKSRSGKDRGRGLGLSIVKKIIEQHEQNIWVNSRVGEGTAFIFSLKAAKKPDRLPR